MNRRRSLRPIERAAPLRLEVYAKVREAIVDGTLAPGSALVSTELAGRLGVSRTPVREAIARLIQDGLAVDEGGGRAVVRPVSRQEIADFFEIRAALEAVAARRAVERAGGGWLPRLRAAEQRLEAAVAGGAPRTQQRRLNEVFHGLLYEGSGNRLLAPLLRDLETITARAVIERLYERADPEMTVRDHRRIVAAIEAGDAAAAARAAAEHVGRAGTYLLGILDDEAPTQQEAG